MSLDLSDNLKLDVVETPNQPYSISENSTVQEEQSLWSKLKSTVKSSFPFSFSTDNKGKDKSKEDPDLSEQKLDVPKAKPPCLMNYTVHQHNMTITGACRQMYTWSVLAYDYLMNSTLRRLNVTETGVYKQLHYWSSVAYGWLSTGISVVYHQLSAWGSIVYEYLMNNAILRRLKVTEIAVVLNRWISVAYNWVLAWCITVYDRLYSWWYGDGEMSVRAPTRFPPSLSSPPLLPQPSLPLP